MKNVIPSAKLIEATKEAVKARAIVEVLRPRIVELQTSFLQEYEVFTEDGERITEPKEMYRVTDEHAESMYLALDKKYRSAGYELPIETGYYPLLMAENTERKANRKMNELAMELVPVGKRFDISSVWNMDDLKKLTNLNMQYVSQFIK